MGSPEGRIERVWESDFVRLLRAAGSVVRPMLIPLVGIALIAALKGDSTVRLVVVLVGLLALAALIWPKKANREATWEAIAAMPPVLVLAAVPSAAFVIIQAKTGDDRIVDFWDFISRLLVTMGFGLWAAAFVVRAAAFARNPARLFLVAVALAAYVRYFFGLFVAGDRLPTTVDHVVWGVLIAVALVLVWAVERRFGGRPGERGPTVAWLHRAGLSAAIIAAISFFLAGAAGLLSDPEVERVRIRDLEERRARDVPAPPVADWIDDPGRLAAEFAPLLGLTDGQRWEPIDVESYLRDAELFVRRPKRGGKERAPALLKEKLSTPADLPIQCPPGTEGICYELTIHCPVKQSDDSDCEKGTDPREGRVTAGTAYVRVIYADTLSRPDRDPAARAAERSRRDRVFGRLDGKTYGPYGDELEAIVQYWLFYYYDDWKARTLFGQLRQAHEADWEVITVGLSRKAPLFLGLSAHCGGTWLPWGDAKVTDGNHPIVGVAEGSQANYADPEENIPPTNWARCAKLPYDASTLSLGYRVRDRTGIHTLLQPAHLSPVHDESEIIRFPGRWGRFSTAHFYTAFRREHELQDEGFGPESPGHQRLWYDTVMKTFCDPSSKQVGDGRQLRKNCPPQAK